MIATPINDSKCAIFVRTFCTPSHVSSLHTPNPYNTQPTILIRDHTKLVPFRRLRDAPAFSPLAFTSSRPNCSRPPVIFGPLAHQSSHHVTQSVQLGILGASFMELYEDEPGEYEGETLLQMKQAGFQSLLEPEVIVFRGWGIGLLGERRCRMSSFALEDFVGNGALLDQIDSLTQDGWADVPTLKVMSKDDMDMLRLSQQQRNALELRTYLHDRSLMKYADTLELSGRTLTELLSTSPTQLTTQYRMRRGHVARFLDMGSTCSIKLPSDLVLPARQISAAHHAGGDLTDESSPQAASPYEMAQSYPSRKAANSFSSFNSNDDSYKAPVLVTSGQSAAVVSRGMFSAPAAEPRLCGFVRPKTMNDEVTPVSVLDKIMIQKLTPEHRKGNNPFKKGSNPKAPLPAPTKVSDLWAEKPTLLLCLRRSGCVMCRAEAHQLYSRKPIFDAMGIQLVVCVNDHIESELTAFWPRYWGGMVVLDEKKDFFRALGQGKVRRENYLTGFFLNPTTLANFKRATSTGMAWNTNGHGTIKGGLYIIRAGNGGVAYQFVERNFGDWAPLDEVLQACADISQTKPGPKH